MDNSSDDILARLLDLHPKRIDLSLGRVLSLAEKLGNPHEDLPPIVHVGGTNGKGSCIAFLESMLIESGYSVGRYTSPHLCDFNERIVFNGESISDSDLSGFLAECESANDGEAITFFEITTLAAFLAFSRRRMDILLLEVGLGGRLDATNIVRDKLLSIITPISVDHQEFLGGTISEIAIEKCGIIEDGGIVVAMADDGQAIEVVRERANIAGADLYMYGDDFSVVSVDEQGDISLQFGDKVLVGVRQLSLVGEHQFYNASLAFAASMVLEGLGFPMSDDSRKEGLSKAQWRGRLQNLNGSVLGERLGCGWDIYLDGGHNLAAGGILSAQLLRWREFDDCPIYVIFAMVSNKDAEGFLSQLSPYIEQLIVLPLSCTENCYSVAELGSIAESLDIECIGCGSFEEALQSLPQNLSLSSSGSSSSGMRLLICGSLYLVGEVLGSFE